MAPTDLPTTRCKPWMCVRCGYTMDSASPILGKKRIAPKEHDVSLCLNCGASYTMRDGRWALLTPAERERLPANLRFQMLRAEVARSAAITTDLSRRDQRSIHGPH